MERVRGIEPLSLAWKAKALPLCYTRIIELGITLLQTASYKIPCIKQAIYIE